MAGKGGFRPGAGRKPMGLKRAIYASPLHIAEAKIAEQLPWLVDQLLILAAGVEVQRTDRQGQTRIYSDPPDRAAIEYLMDRIMGKPKQPVDVTIRQEAERVAAEMGIPVEEALAEVEAILAARAK